MNSTSRRAEQPRFPGSVLGAAGRTLALLQSLTCADEVIEGDANSSAPGTFETCRDVRYSVDIVNRRDSPISEVGPSPAAARYALMRGAGTETHG